MKHNIDQRFTLSGVNLINPATGEISVSDIVISGDIIDGLTPYKDKHFDAAGEVIDGRGKYAIPGLWDAHIHLTSWAALEESLPSLLVSFGVTSVRDMGAPLERILALKAKSQNEEFVSPRIYCAGPFINSPPQWGHEKSVEAGTAVEAIELVDQLIEAGVDFIKPYEMLKADVFKALIERAKYHGVRTAGHAPAELSLSQMLDIAPKYDLQHLGGQCTGLKFDCVHNTHAMRQKRYSLLEEGRCVEEMGAMLLLKLEKGVPVSPEDFAPDKRDALVRLFVEKETWNTPTLVTICSLRALGTKDNASRLEMLSRLPEAITNSWNDFLSAYGDIIERRQAWSEIYLDTVGLLAREGAQIMVGTDSPPTADYCPGQAVHVELQALVKAGLTPLQALKAATVNPAQFLGLEDSMGTVEVGKVADIVLLNENPLEDISNTLGICGVVSRGQYFDPPALSRMAHGPRGAAAW